MPGLADLTADEAKEFTTFNLVAYNVHREEAKAADSIPPAWLCMSDKAKAEIREKGVSWLNGAMRPIVPFTLETAEKVLNREFASRMAPQLEQWRNFERELKQARSENNPLAFFVHHSNG